MDRSLSRRRRRHGTYAHGCARTERTHGPPPRLHRCVHSVSSPGRGRRLSSLSPSDRGGPVAPHRTLLRGCRLSTSDGVPEVARARRTRLMVRVTQVPVDDRGASVRQCPRGDSLPRHTTPRRPVMNCVHRGRAGGHLGARGGPAADHHLARGARPPSPGRAAAPDLRRVCAATAHGRRPNWCVGAWSWRCASLQVR